MECAALLLDHGKEAGNGGRVYMDAHIEWALYEMDVVSWLLMSVVGDEECGSWAAADVRFALPTPQVEVRSQWISAGGY